MVFELRPNIVKKESTWIDERRGKSMNYYKVGKLTSSRNSKGATLSGLD